MGQFDWTPDEYLERIRLRIPRYDELQEQAVAAVPFPPERVLELGMGTGETTRRLIEAHARDGRIAAGVHRDAEDHHR